LTQPGPEAAELSARALIRRHKLAAGAAFAVLVVTVAMLVAVVLAPRNGALGDSTSCTQWSSSSQDQMQAFANRYLGQHGNVTGQVAGAAGVVAAVNAGCMAAFSSDEEDNVTVLDAIEKRY
jgi:hypothetical protein